VEVDILYGHGISREGDLVDFGVAQGVVEKSGSWYSYGGERVGQGRDNARTFLLANPEIRDRVEAALRIAAGFAPAEPDAVAKPAASTPSGKHAQAQIA